MKALLIDPAQKTVTEIELDGSLTSIYKVLNCSLITSVVSFPNEDTMYADDEGLYADEITGGIMLPDWSYPVVNKILVMGTNKNGDSVDVKTPIHLLAKQIRWINKEMAESWAEQFH